MAYLGFGKNLSALDLQRPQDLLEITVLTTEQILKREHDITFAAYFADENLWQFFSNQNPNNFEDQLCVVKMTDVVNIDPSVMEIGEIPDGYIALRSSKNEAWYIQPLV